MTRKELLQLIFRGGPGFIQVAVTNACNAHCHFCKFPQVPAAGKDEPNSTAVADVSCPRYLSRHTDDK